MSYDKVKQASKTIIGTKQAVKAMHAGQVTEVFVALDADNIGEHHRKILAAQHLDSALNIGND